MVKLPNKGSSNYMRLYYAVFLLLTFAIIYLLFPKQVTFKYEFQKGKPWGHETLIASFDFPILKPKEVLQAERDSVLKNHYPYFAVDTLIEKQQLTMLRIKLESAFNESPKPVSATVREDIMGQIETLFKQLYKRGILENSIESYDILKEKEYLNMVTNNISERVPLSQILSIKTAYLQINNELTNLANTNSTVLNILKNIDPDNFLAANLTYDKAFNDMQVAELLQQVSISRGVIQSGMRIISEGDMVTGENFIVLESLKQAYERDRSYSGWISTIIIGQMILILVMFSMMVLYLQSFNKVLFWKKRNFTMILFTVLATFVLARLIYENSSLSMYLLPVCILPIIIRTFLGARMAIYIHFITMLIISFMAPNSFEFFFLQAVAGTVAVISLSKLHRRGQLVITSLLIFAAYSIMYFAFEMIKEGSINNIEWGNFKWFIGNGLLLLITYPILYIIEKMFGFISDVTLVELSDTNHPLLRKLAEIAPGTFQHSMQVANLAEAVIVRIGGNPLLVRTGALYHDVGKINSSEFFIENQVTGINPHDKMSHIKSVEKIVGHVFDGVRLAHKYKLPEPIIDFIKMHHGKGLVKYFYLKYKEENPGKPVKEEDFMYPGPNPTSRETAVVMLADGVEAAARSLPEKNEHTLKAIIDQIIDSKITNRELDDAPITFRDIKDIKAIFLEKMRNVYHVRIQYPKETNQE